MKITIGIRNFAELLEVINIGANEVYCGVLEIRNHRPPTKEYNFESFNELIHVIKIAHESDIKIYFLANELYGDAEANDIAARIKILQRFNIDGIIARDLTLISLLNKIGFNKKIILSSLAEVFNSEALKFYLKFNISRLILPQHLTVREILSIRKKVKIEMEVFFKKEEYCKNIDGLCFFHDLDLFRKIKESYTDYSSMLCPANKEDNYRQRKFKNYPCKYDFKGSQRIIKTRRRINSYLRTSFLEDFYILFHMGTEYAKIKRYGGNKLLSELWLAKELTQMLKAGVSKKMFLKNGKEAMLNVENDRKSGIYQ